MNTDGGANTRWRTRAADAERTIADRVRRHQTATAMIHDINPTNARPIARPNARLGRRGFTLLEMMLVMLLIGGLTAIVVAINFIGKAEQARIDLTITKMRTLQQELQAYNFRHGVFPTSADGLNVLVNAAGVQETMLKDEWGTPFAYYAPTNDPMRPYDLISDGPDRIPDTEDDIDIWYVDQNNR